MLSEKMLLEIRKRYEHYGEAKPNTAVHDIQVLLDELQRTRYELRLAQIELAIKKIES